MRVRRRAAPVLVGSFDPTRRKYDAGVEGVRRLELLAERNELSLN